MIDSLSQPIVETLYKYVGIVDLLQCLSCCKRQGMWRIWLIENKCFILPKHAKVMAERYPGQKFCVHLKAKRNRDIIAACDQLEPHLQTQLHLDVGFVGRINNVTWSQNLVALSVACPVTASQLTMIEWPKSLVFLSLWGL